MSEKMKSWFRERMGFFVLLSLLIGAVAGAGLYYWFDYKSQEKTIRLGAFISDTDNQIYTVEKRQVEVINK
jgi:hypothetical protein